MELFRRRARVVIHRLEITGLRVAFQVEKTSDREPNTAEIRIYNLNQDHRGQLEQAGEARVRLEAGYAPPQLSQGTEEALQSIGLERDGRLPVIFRGDLREVWSAREGPDWVTVLRTGDGEKGHRRSRSKTTFRPGLKWRQVMRQMADASGIDPGNALQVIDQMGDLELASGVTVQGSSAEQIDRIVESFGLEWTIHDGELQLVERGKSLAGTAVVLSPETGLVGSPEPGNKGLIRFRSLLQAEIFPMRKIELRSRHISGFYRVERVNYTGDTHGPDWYTEGEARTL